MKTVVVILLLIIIGAGGFYLGQKYKFVPAASTVVTVPTQAETITLPPDSKTTLTQTVTVVPTVDETATLIAAMKAAIIAKRGADAAALDYTVNKIQGNYALGAASDTVHGGGGMWFAAKVSGKWQLVWDGNGIIQCSDLTNYPDFPKSMIPECYNMATQQNVVR